VRIFCSGLLSVVAFGLLLVCVGGLSGCDSKPADGTVVPDSGPVSAEQKAKVKALYVDRHKSATKQPAGKPK
jgi:hypothetical protein